MGGRFKRGEDKLLTWSEAWPQPDPGQDASGKYREGCRELAKELGGFTMAEIWGAWGQISLAIEFELKRPRSYAEWLAMDVVRGAFDKRGAADPS